MSVRVTWQPSTELDILNYVLERADSATGPWVQQVIVTHDLLGPNYDVNSARFFYVDNTGNGTKWYRLFSVDTAAQVSTPSSAFQVSGLPALPNVVAVDHNYGFPGSLRYQTAGGIPVEAALIRIWRKADFDAGNTDAPLAITMTNAQGNWINPCNLTTGFTYVVQFAKEGLYGPDKTEIVV